ncbi:unnamed protein product [Candidula unifasciata]|uniref:Uncharacterized protein n=1 Tax=Candidula unifasciata TaxID=100452 RepID=A0A8S3YZL9_9EUPU|nr:unnamed protein product [Candidula unifasciata]
MIVLSCVSIIVLSCVSMIVLSCVSMIVLSCVSMIVQSYGKVCVKREELGNREGNLYNCDNPDLNECCERNRTFTCCQPAVVAIWHDQLWLLLSVVVLAVLMCVVISWCYGQSEFFRSPTAKDAAKNWKDKFYQRPDNEQQC